MRHFAATYHHTPYPATRPSRTCSKLKRGSFGLSECIVFLQLLPLLSLRLLLPFSAVNCAAKVVAVHALFIAAPTKEGHPPSALRTASCLQSEPLWTFPPHQKECVAQLTCWQWALTVIWAAKHWWSFGGDMARHVSAFSHCLHVFCLCSLIFAEVTCWSRLSIGWSVNFMGCRSSKGRALSMINPCLKLTNAHLHTSNVHISDLSQWQPGVKSFDRKCRLNTQRSRSY